MNPKLLYTLSGYLSLLIGIAAASCVFKMALMPIGIGLAIVGILAAVLNIFLNTRFQFDVEKFPKGYLGLFLSSLPVLFMLFMIFKSRAN